MHRTPFQHTVLAASLLLALAACSKEPAASKPVVAEMRLAEEAKAPPPPPAAPAMEAKDKATGILSKEKRDDVADKPASSQPVVAQQLVSSAASYTDSERKFVRTAGANFMVKDVYASALAIEDVAAGLNGFVTRNDIRTETKNVERHPISEGKILEVTSYTVQGALTIRVPSNKTQEFLRGIIGQVVFLDQRSFSAHDAQFDMLRKLLEYRREQETQEELGQATREGGRLLQKADVIEGRKQARAARDEALVERKEFDDKVAYSTIELTLYQTPMVRQSELQDIESVFRKNRPGFFARVGESMHNGWESTLDLLVGLAGGWPLWLLLGLSIPLAMRIRKLMRAKQD